VGGGGGGGERFATAVELQEARDGKWSPTAKGEQSDIGVIARWHGFESAATGLRASLDLGRRKEALAQTAR